jgi:putative transposase
VGPKIVKRRQCAFRFTGLTWIVERSIAWLNRDRRLAEDHEYRVQSYETMVDIAAIRLMVTRLTPA